MTKIPSVTIIVVARNEANTITTCIASLVAQDYAVKHIILVDDGSTDNTVDLAKSIDPDIEVIFSPTRSISTNRNVGWQACKTPYVAFLDADCEAPKSWLSTLVECAQSTGAAAVGGGNKPPTEESSHYQALSVMLNTYVGSRGSIQGQVPTKGQFIEHLPTLNVLYQTEALKLAGGFDTRFARMGEDEDLSRRLGNMAFRLYASPDATVIHRQRSDVKSWARNMYKYGQGRTWLLRRHPNAWSPVFMVPPVATLLLPVYLPIIAIYALFACIKAQNLRLWPNVFMLFLATHIPYAFGQIHGLFLRGDTPETKSRRKRIAMLALKNAGNKGDEALVRCVSMRMANKLSDIDHSSDAYLAAFGPSGFDIRPMPQNEVARDRVILDMLAPSNTSRRVRPSTLLADAARCLLVFARFQAVFISGGQWLHDLSKAKHYAICSLFGFARLFRTKTGVFCVGVGPLSGGVSQWFVRRGFGAKSLLVTRDDKSTAYLHACKRTHAYTATDPAIELPTATMNSYAGYVLISPCAWANFENIYALDNHQIEESFNNWVTLVDGLRERGHKLAILPTMNPEDREFGQRIIDAVGDIECIDTEPLTPPEVQGHIASASALISMRLHPAIFASNCGTYFVSLNYADKVRAYCHQSNLADQLVDLASKNWANEVLDKLDAHSDESWKSNLAAARKTQILNLDKAYKNLFLWLGM